MSMNESNKRRMVVDDLPIEVSHLFRCLSRRLRAAAVGNRFRQMAIILAALALIVLLASRLLALFPIPNSFESFCMLPLMALIAALLFHRHPTTGDAARLLDRHTRSKDLFLTVSLIGSALGAYQELVIAEARDRATKIKAGQILKFRWRRPAVEVLASFLVVLMALLFLPQLDPFGREQQRRQAAQTRDRLREMEKATALRAKLLNDNLAEPAGDPVDQAVTDLQKTFRDAKPDQKVGTFNRLNQHQKELAELWRRVSEKRKQSTRGATADRQTFGSMNPEKTARWKKDLKEGSTDSMKKELDQLKELAQKLADSEDAVERQHLHRELMDRMQDLQEALSQSTDSPALQAALQRACEQLQMAEMPSLSREAMQGLMDSLDLSEMELSELAADLADMKRLEEALKALQSAKRLHSVKPLDGEACGECQGIGDYAALFNSMYAAQSANSAGMGPGVGAGMGPGQGIGERPYGDESTVTEFKPEQADSHLQAGKMLLSWKTKEVSMAGKARENYQDAISSVRQRAGEALDKEQIPPSYHAIVRSYFDNLEDDR